MVGIGTVIPTIRALRAQSSLHLGLSTGATIVTVIPSDVPVNGRCARAVGGTRLPLWANTKPHGPGTRAIGDVALLDALGLRLDILHGQHAIERCIPPYDDMPCSAEHMQADEGIDEELSDQVDAQRRMGQGWHQWRLGDVE